MACDARYVSSAAQGKKGSGVYPIRAALGACYHQTKRFMLRFRGGQQGEPISKAIVVVTRPVRRGILSVWAQSRYRPNHIPPARVYEVFSGAFRLGEWTH